MNRLFTSISNLFKGGSKHETTKAKQQTSKPKIAKPPKKRKLPWYAHSFGRFIPDLEGGIDAARRERKVRCTKLGISMKLLRKLEFCERNIDNPNMSPAWRKKARGRIDRTVKA